MLIVIEHLKVRADNLRHKISSHTHTHFEMAYRIRVEYFIFIEKDRSAGGLAIGGSASVRVAQRAR